MAKVTDGRNQKFKARGIHNNMTLGKNNHSKVEKISILINTTLSKSTEVPHYSNHTCVKNAYQDFVSKFSYAVYDMHMQPPSQIISQEKPKLSQETRFISDISWDLTQIFSKQYFMKLTWLNLSKISISLSSV